MGPSSAQIIEACLPSKDEQMTVLARLADSSNLAGSISPAAWSLTKRDDGFRLNVGQVEVLGLFGTHLRVLMAASKNDARLRGLNCQETAYASILGPQCAFTGSVAEYLAAKSVVEPLHLRFVELAARTRSGKPRNGTPFSRHHSEELMGYAVRAVRGDLPAHEEAAPAYSFRVGEGYTRRDVFRTIGIDEPTGGPWFTGYASHGPDWFIFCGVGTHGRTGHDYGNHFDGERLVWFAKGPSTLTQASIQDLLNPGGRVYVFYREGERDPFTFAGLASATEVFDTSPVKVVWSFEEPGGQRLPTTLPEEVDQGEGGTVSEGARKTIEVNVYERDPNARRKCIAHWGTACAVCTFSFANKYGALGEGFIHVHHLRPLGEVGEAYELDPIVDLRPVCPNCHAMLHRRRPALTIEELQSEMSPLR